MMHKAWCGIERVPYCFPRSSIKFQGHTGKKIADFDPNWEFPDCKLQFQFTDWFEMIHKAWCSIEEVPYYFSRSYIKFQGHTGWKMEDLDQIWARLLGRSQLSNPPDLPCYFKVQFDLEGQGQLNLKTIWILAKVLCILCPNLIAWTGGELSRGHGVDTHACKHTQRHGQTNAGNYKTGG